MKKLFQILAAVAALSFLTACEAEAGGGDVWLTDFEAAQAQARETGRPLLLDFTGSDWCPPCMAMHQQVFSTERFEQYAAANVVPVLVDFPNRKPMSDEQRQKNEALAGRFSVAGLPTYILLSPDGQVLARHVGYMDGGPEAFIEFLSKAAKKE